MRGAAEIPGYERTDGAVPVVHPPRLSERARVLRDLLAAGRRHLSEMLDEEPPELRALLVAGEDWREAPRENSRPYPPGLPYFTRSAEPPALVLPEELSPAFGPRTAALLPLTVWHELAHAFLLKRPVPPAPAWLREFLPQACAAAVARRSEVPLEEHLSKLDREPGFAVRSFSPPASAGDQMAFQNLLLSLSAAALEEFGEGFVGGLAGALWEEPDSPLGEERAEELLAEALGAGSREWLEGRPEF